MPRKKIGIRTALTATNGKLVEKLATELKSGATLASQPYMSRNTLRAKSALS